MRRLNTPSSLMIHFFWKTKFHLLILIFLFSATFVQTQTQEEFARSLMRERDYFRAISEYKELAFFSKNTDSTIFYLSQIGKAYRLSAKYDLSIDTYSSLLNSHHVSNEINTEIQINLGLNYLGMKLPLLASSYFQSVKDIDTSGRALFYSALLNCELGRWNEAKGLYDNLSMKNSISRVGVLSAQFSSQVSHVDMLSYRSPALSAIFSAIVPGSGQIYCQHYVDGLQAFAFVSAFAFASYAIYTYDKEFSPNFVLTGISVSITTLFHIANIIGAEKTAAYFNQRQTDLFLEEIRKKSLELEN